MENMPEIQGNLRKFSLTVPKAINRVSGIKIFGKVIKSIAFTTDISIIRNCNANAIMAVYPFTPQPVITNAVMMAADLPVFCGVGGGLTTGKRVANLALHAEYQGAIGVVLNGPTSNKVVKSAKDSIDIPVVVTVLGENDDISGRIEAGADILNVSAADKTPSVVKKIREKYPDLPIIATGGPRDDTIDATIDAGANAITWTPPSSSEIFTWIMNEYRAGRPHP